MVHEDDVLTLRGHHTNDYQCGCSLCFNPCKTHKKSVIFKNTYFSKIHTFQKYILFNNPCKTHKKSVIFKNTYFSKIHTFQKSVFFQKTREKTRKKCIQQTLEKSRDLTLKIP